MRDALSHSADERPPRKTSVPCFAPWVAGGNRLTQSGSLRLLEREREAKSSRRDGLGRARGISVGWSGKVRDLLLLVKNRIEHDIMT